MKITIESTSCLVDLVSESGHVVPARVWVGVTEKGIPVQCLVTRIAADKRDDLQQFEAELDEQDAPRPTVLAWPLRMLL
jgi:hypothetical protein